MPAHRPAARSRLGLSRPPEPHRGHRGVSPAFKELLDRHDWKDKWVVDIGCGTGAATVLLAKRGAHAVGVDLDPGVLLDASERAHEEGVESARFVCADAEAVDYRALAGAPGSLDGVVAHLCFSDRIAKRAAAALGPGAVFMVRAFHQDQWKQAGFRSPFAMSVPAMRGLLRRVGFDVTRLEVERRSQRFESLEDFAEKFLSDPGRRAQWQDDGRLTKIAASFRRGNRTLSEAFLVVEAVRRPAPAEPKRARKRAPAR
jgi:SAM-dependent methyltransferase